METWYKVNRYIYGDRKWIEVKEFDRSTDAYLWTGKRRRVKRSECDNYFPTFEEAKQFALSRAENWVNNAKWNLDEALKEYNAIYGL